MKALKITNPLWLGSIGPQINDFVKKVPVQGITYESFYTYLAQSVQFGGEINELWAVIDTEGPVGLAHWLVLGLPYIGTVLCDGIYSWTKDRESASLLVDEFINFGLKHKAPIYTASLANEKIYQIFSKHAKDKGYEIIKSGLIHMVGRKSTKEVKNE